LFLSSLGRQMNSLPLREFSDLKRQCDQ
jgi:hypothetical protein